MRCQLGPVLRCAAGLGTPSRYRSVLNLSVCRDVRRRRQHSRAGASEASPAASQLLAGRLRASFRWCTAGGVTVRLRALAGFVLLPPAARSCFSASASCAALTLVGCLVVGQYLILANAARGRAGVALIQQAISNPQLFHFGELIDHENIAALDGAGAPTSRRRMSTPSRAPARCMRCGLATRASVVPASPTRSCRNCLLCARAV